MKTTYIIGAGASMDYGFPTGDKLKEDISTMYRKNDDGTFNNDQVNSYYNKLVTTFKNKEYLSLDHEAHELNSALPTAFSIDNYLDAHNEKADRLLYGKLGILYTINKYEKASPLCIRKEPDKQFNTELLKKSPWHLSFFHSLIEGCDFERFKNRIEDITLIIFNYDRCIEQFLLLAIQIYYEVDEESAKDSIRSLQIIHPYGSIGKLPWLANSSSYSLDYGQNIVFGSMQSIAISNELKTFTEELNPKESEIADAKTALFNSSRVVTLGFAFHHMNLKLLSISDFNDLFIDNERTLFGTAFNISKSDIESIKAMCQKFLKISHRNIALSDQKCDAFFNSYRLSLNYER
ncbi:hypothetical protein [Saccharospirillum mangrovi]|uniref:hypothetical protein n=1 Tax=Saccharospirillum mangrovi TaxID=2161747 RepID=UPI000D3357C5|nr:hypothetical protein [Saccharospirillum mangrovi]